LGKVSQILVGCFVNCSILGTFVNFKTVIVKIEQLVVQHLYQNKELTLQGIGTFYLNPAIALPAEGDKDFVMPDDAFQFSIT
jgi:hypothetical protein